MINDNSITLAQQFRESEGRPIYLNDKLVYSVYTRKYTATGYIRIRFKRATKTISQALCVKVKNGLLQINKTSIKDQAVLWADTAPAVVDVTYRFKDDGEISFWNAWKGGDEIQHAWLGNAGIIVDEFPDCIKLNCSDGIGSPNFTDLVVEIVDHEKLNRHEKSSK